MAANKRHASGVLERVPEVELKATVLGVRPDYDKRMTGVSEMSRE